jgi:hypothetical protein
MTCAIIQAFGFFQISVFFNPGILLMEHLAQTNARGLMDFFSHTVSTEILSAQSVRFCTDLSES